MRQAFLPHQATSFILVALGITKIPDGIRIMKSEDHEKPVESCVQGITRQEFLKKLITKAAVAGTFAILLEATTVKVHPGYAAGATVG
jgi:hypothetical protein